jgi:two-component system, OmpR family, alkaline phosphatase synthesis response regulator PhoP
MAEKILLIEDENKIARTLRLYLEQAGYQVATVDDGALAMPAFRREQPDLVILDLMLPHVDGWKLCSQMRQTSAVPIIMLTARSEETDRVVGLELGADDYVTKPFSPREVLARVRAVLRRTQGAMEPARLIHTGDVIIDLDRYEVTVAGRPLDLTRHELLLFAALAQSPGRVFTRLQLLDQLDEAAYTGYERVVDQHIKNLRAKLGDDARQPRYLATVYGVGYKWIAGTVDDA